MPDIINIVFIISNIIIFVCEFVCFKIGTLIWKPKISVLFPCIVGATILSAVNIGCSFLNNEPATHLIHVFAYFLLFKLLFHISSAEAAFTGVFSTFNLMCWRGIISGIISLIMKKNTFQVLSVDLYSLIISTLAVVITLFVLLYYKSPAHFLRMKVFFSCQNELNTVLSLQAALGLFMLFNSYNNYYNLDIIWFSLAQISTPAIMFVIYIMIFNYGIKIANLLQKELWQENLTEQIKLRFAHRQTYQKTFEKISEFKHVYRENMVAANYCLEKNDIKALTEILNVKMPSLVENLPVVELFSNVPEYDAALFDWYNISIANSIDFNAKLFIPTQSTIKPYIIHNLLQLLRELHTPLAQNSKKNRMISINSKALNNWLSVQTVSSFNGIIENKDDLPYFVVDDGIKTKTSYRNLNEFAAAEKMLISYTSDNKTHQFSTTISVYFGK
ncbi:MAG: hypothetical protein RR424_02935 [Oscillospiraceae bacterium]